MDNRFTMTWHEAVQWYKNLPNNEENVLNNYFDDNILEAAQRYYESNEFKEISKLLRNSTSVLDIAAGRGIASYGFSKLGKNVTALEPDKSELTGNKAIKKLIKMSSLNIEVIESYSENLPLKDNSFDAVFVRQGVHHFQDMKKSLKEIYRVLKPTGIFLAVREHVLEKDEDLAIFLNNHPLHKHYGGENAYTLDTYIKNIKDVGLKDIKIIEPFSSDINLFPNSSEKIKEQIIRKLGKKEISENTFKYEIEQLNKNIKTPGILYSFLARKERNEQK